MSPLFLARKTCDSLNDNTNNNVVLIKISTRCSSNLVHRNIEIRLRSIAEIANIYSFPIKSYIHFILSASISR